MDAFNRLTSEIMGALNSMKSSSKALLTAISSHIANHNNPHGLTAEYLKVPTKASTGSAIGKIVDAANHMPNVDTLDGESYTNEATWLFSSENLYLTQGNYTDPLTGGRQSDIPLDYIQSQSQWISSADSVSLADIPKGGNVYSMLGSVNEIGMTVQRIVVKARTAGDTDYAIWLPNNPVTGKVTVGFAYVYVVSGEAGALAYDTNGKPIDYITPNGLNKPLLAGQYGYIAMHIDRTRYAGDINAPLLFTGGTYYTCIPFVAAGWLPMGNRDQVLQLANSSRSYFNSEYQGIKVYDGFVNKVNYDGFANADLPITAAPVKITIDNNGALSGTASADMIVRLILDGTDGKGGDIIYTINGKDIHTEHTKDVGRVRRTLAVGKGWTWKIRTTPYSPGGASPIELAETIALP